jgi:nicotinamide-nucleotide amidase
MNDECVETVGRLLRQRGQLLAVAESCTGGLLGARLTALPGSSRFFVGGVIAYANAVKERVLGVPAPVLEREGAVSAAVAALMAEGVARVLRTDVAVAVTGIAGPEGGSADKPVGLVFGAVFCDSEVTVQEYRFKGAREAIRAQAADAALRLLRDRLISV